MEAFRFIWTRRAVDRYRQRATLDPRHTVSLVEADLSSPWLERDFDQRASNSDWLLVDQAGHIAAGRERGRFWRASV